ncbi:MAG: hypothetical protein AB7R69_00150 [Candidatus Babeliales bacterium]
MKDNPIKEKNNILKKKILIFSCHGGGGHMSAALAIEANLGQHETKIIDAMAEPVEHLDPLYYLSFKKFSGQRFYNFLLRYNKKRLVNLFFQFGSLMIDLNKKSLYKTFSQVIEKEKPDLIISVIPLLNQFFAKIAEEKNIPYVLVPTDLDIKTFIKNIKLDHKYAKLCLGFDFPEIKNSIKPGHIPGSAIAITGFPIRPAFFEKKNKDYIKQKLAITHNHPIVLLVMGATGSNVTLKYLYELIKIKMPFHLIICTGRSYYLKKLIKTISFPDTITFTIADGDAEISDFMAITNICITKPGSVTFAETLYMDIPVLIDNTTPALLWEQKNIDMVKNYGIGSIITHLHDVKRLVTSYIIDKELRVLTQHNIKALPKKYFNTEFSTLINTIFTEQEKNSF